MRRYEYVYSNYADYSVVEAIKKENFNKKIMQMDSIHLSRAKDCV